MAKFGYFWEWCFAFKIADFEVKNRGRTKCGSADSAESAESAENPAREWSEGEKRGIRGVF